MKPASPAEVIVNLEWCAVTLANKEICLAGWIKLIETCASIRVRRKACGPQESGQACLANPANNAEGHDRGCFGGGSNRREIKQEHLASAPFTPSRSVMESTLAEPSVTVGQLRSLHSLHVGGEAGVKKHATCRRRP